MDWVEHSHLALGHAGKAIAPEIIPHRQPPLPQRLAQKAHQADEKLRYIAADGHLAADADRPEPSDEYQHDSEPAGNAHPETTRDPRGLIRPQATRHPDTPRVGIALCMQSRRNHGALSARDRLKEIFSKPE